MRRLLASALALTLVAGASALAAPPDNAYQQVAQNDHRGDQNGPRKKQDQTTRQQRRNQATVQKNQRAVQQRQKAVQQRQRTVQQRQQAVQQRQRTVQQNQRAVQQRQQAVQQRQRTVQQRRRYDWNTYQPGRRPPNWQQYQRNFNARAYERNYRAQRRYRWTPYAAPRGWSYRRWTYGQMLPSLFWGRSYWVNRYTDYGLMDPPYGYVWVRYGNDALLVNVENGRILQVVYDLYE